MERIQQCWKFIYRRSDMVSMVLHQRLEFCLQLQLGQWGFCRGSFLRRDKMYINIISILSLLIGVMYLSMSGAILFSDFIPHKNAIGISYISLGLFLIAFCVSNFLM